MANGSAVVEQNEYLLWPNIHFAQLDQIHGYPIAPSPFLTKWQFHHTKLLFANTYLEVLL
jgi:hypothetical protein